MAAAIAVVAAVTAVTALLACSPGKNGSQPAQPRAADCEYDGCPQTPAAIPAPAAAAAAPTSATATGPAPVARGSGPIAERAQLLREAADQLDKAQAALDNGNRNLAEQLFSTAELLVGAEILASIAPRFREGAPPRVTTPTQKVEPAPPQPRVAGSSEAEDEKDHVPPPRIEASLSGTMQIDGHPASGAFGLIALEPADGKWKPRIPKHVVVEQRNREFLPRVRAVSVGSTVAFPNFDGVFHNVFSTSPAGPFDLGLYKSNEAREFTFAREGIIRVGCNLHANMTAYIAVVSAPAYVVTDGDGGFAFKHLPPGRYKLKAWSERSKAPVTQDIAIKPGKNTVAVDVTGDAPRGPQPDKFGGKRG
jgi:plastocyanin